MKEKSREGMSNREAVKILAKKKPLLVHHLSSFGVLNRNGLEIPSGIETDSVEREEDSKKTEFAEWSMPEQREGFIQVKKHDFF